ncbi:MAG: hypothetical protein WB716_07455 [Candidatus Acidiferrales bacterium]
MRGNRDGIPNYSKQDLVGEAVLHVYLKVRKGKLGGMPDVERWPYIKKIIWNRMLDLESRSHEIQAGLLDTDKALDEIAAEGAPTWARQNEIRRREIKALEEFIDDALNALPRPGGLLIRLYFGLYRDDEFGSEFPHQGEPVSLTRLADYGFGKSEYAVHRRIQDALGRLRCILIDRLAKQHILNFEGFRVDLPKAA